MKNLSFALIVMTISVCAVAAGPSAKTPPAATDPLYQESADQARGAIVEKKLDTDKKKFKPKQSLDKDVKEAEKLELRDESSPE